MDGLYQYPVFFDSHEAVIQETKKVETYFRVRRRSGGGDCGPLTAVAGNVCCLAFRNQKDQLEVLRRSTHVLELAGGRLVLTVRDSLEPPTSSQNTNPTTPAQEPQSIPASSAPSSGEEDELQLADRQSSMKESQHAEEDLDEDVAQSQPHPAEESTLVVSSTQPGEVGEVSDWKADEDELSDGPCQYEDNSDQSEEFLDAEDMSCLSEDLSSLSLSDGNRVVSSYSLSDGLQVVLCQGDITTLDADALVNAANEDLDHREGVAAALSQAGGPDVQGDSDALVRHRGKIPPGEVVMTTGGKLKCKKLLHAVGPVGEAGGRERVLLERTVQRTLYVAELMKFRSIALPCISSGVCGVAVCSEAVAAAVSEFGHQGGRSLSRIILIDDRGEVVRVMEEACDRILQGVTNRNNPQSDEEFEVDAAAAAAGQDAGSGAAAGGPVSLEIVQGTIETQQVDALVSPMFFHDPFSTRVGNILNKIVGSQMTSMFRKEGGDESLPGDAVLLEGLPGLPSKAVFFLNLIAWKDDDSETAVEVLRLGINNVLTSCENRGFGSVALPVLGAGIALRFPNSVVARVLLEQVHEFELGRASSTPLVVRIVIHPEDEEGREVFKSVQEELAKKTQQQDQHQASTTKRLILLGKTGSGKSHLANTIFGENLFTANHTPNSGTRACQAETKAVNGRSLTLIDTPGFFDTDKSEVDVKPEIMNCITECAPGPHAFLIVLPVGKFSKHEQEVFDKICEYFSEDALKHAVIVFTHGDQLPKGVKIEEFVGQNQKLSDLVKSCGGRCHVFDSRYWKNNQQNNYRSNCFQLEALLRTIDEMVMEKNGRYYTNDVLQNVEKKIKKQEMQIRVSSANLSPHEIRKRAKIMVSNEFLIQLAGTATGALLGAFLGLAVMVEAVIRAVRSPSEAMRLVKKIPAVAGAPAAVAAGGETALVAGVVAGVAAAGVAAAGGVMGGVVGHDAAKGAKTPLEAAERAAEAVMKIKKEKLP